MVANPASYSSTILLPILLPQFPHQTPGFTVLILNHGPGYLALYFFHRWQAWLEIVRQGTGKLIFGDADRLLEATQGVLQQQPVRAFFLAAEDEAHGRLVVRMPQYVVHRIEIEVHLASVLGGKWTSLEVNDQVAAELQVIEEQINVIVLVTDGQSELVTDKSEPGTELNEELAQVGQQGILKLPLADVIRKTQKIEDVGSFSMSRARSDWG